MVFDRVYEKAITLKEVGLRMGSAQSQISQIVNKGSDISINSLTRLAKALDLTVEIKLKKNSKEVKNGR